MPDSSNTEIVLIKRRAFCICLGFEFLIQEKEDTGQVFPHNKLKPKGILGKSFKGKVKPARQVLPVPCFYTIAGEGMAG